MKKKNINKVLITLCLFVFVFGLGFKMGEYKTIKNTQIQNKINTFDFNLLSQVLDKLEEKFVDQKKIDSTKLFYGALKGMVASLGDPYTFFLTPEENKEAKNDLGGKFTGIGAQLGLKDNQIIVIAPLKDSPALKAGIKSGDIIKEVDGESTDGWTLFQAVSKIRGDAGSEVQIKISRLNSEDKTFKIKREEIKIESVESKLEKNIDCKSGCKSVGYIKINQFGEQTNFEWNKAVDFILENLNSKKISGLVLDLRDNPGGFLESSVYIASEFLNKGELVVKQESTIGTDKNYTATRNGLLQDVKLVILINEGSASASEILAGALRDYKKATLVGAKTFGKGSVQEALDLKKGAGLHVTVAKWILPNNEWINGKGITPSILIKNEIENGNTLTRDKDQQLEKAIEILLK